MGVNNTTPMVASFFRIQENHHTTRENKGTNIMGVPFGGVVSLLNAWENLVKGLIHSKFNSAV